MFKGSDRKYFQSAALPHIGQSFYLHSRWHSNVHTLFPPPHSAYPESSPKDVTLATSLSSATPEAIKEHPISMHKKDKESGGTWSPRKGISSDFCVALLPKLFDYEQIENSNQPVVPYNQDESENFFHEGFVRTFIRRILLYFMLT